MRITDTVTLLPSAKRMTSRMASADRTRERKLEASSRDLKTKRHLESQRRSVRRAEILGVSYGRELRQRLPEKLASDTACKRALIERTGNMTTPATNPEFVRGKPEITCGSVIAITGSYDSSSENRYELLDKLRGISRPRTATCRRKRIGVTVQFSSRNNRVVMSGVETCSNVHGCPVCAAKIYARRALEVDSMVEQWIGHGEFRKGPNDAYAALLTFTVRHEIDNKLREVQFGISESFRGLFAGRAGQSLRKRLRLKHFVKACEITVGNNGWHPHIHVIALFAQKPSKQDIESLSEAWADSVERSLGQSYIPSKERGFTLKELTESRDGRYVAKMGLEVSGTIDTKAARNGNRTYWQLAKDASEGDARSICLWKEAQDALFMSRQMTWTRGTKSHFGIQDLSDEEIVSDNTEEKKEPMTLEIGSSVWDESCRRDRRFLSRLVSAVSFATYSGDWSGLLPLIKGNWTVRSGGDDSMVFDSRSAPTAFDCSAGRESKFSDQTLTPLTVSNNLERCL